MRMTRKLAGLAAMTAMLVLAGCRQDMQNQPKFILLAGCRQDMQNQPKFIPQSGTTFYASGRSVRPQVEDTVARNQMDQDAYFYTGIQDAKEGDGLPIPLNAATLERGQERYNIYCAPCHSRVGNGAGMIV